jgi:hypothetical protein
MARKTRITGKQRAARKRNIKIAQTARAGHKRGSKGRYKRSAFGDKPRDIAVTRKSTRRSKNPTERSAGKTTRRPRDFPMANKTVRSKAMSAISHRSVRRMKISMK